MVKVFTADDIDFSMFEAATEMKHKIREAYHYLEQVEKRLFNPDESPSERLPWLKTANQIRFGKGETTLWGGMNGHGKSLVLGQVTTGFVAQGAKVCIASLEMKPRETLVRMIRQAAGEAVPRNFPGEFLAWAGNRLWLYDHQGRVERNKILSVLRYCAEELHINHFVLDSLMKCGVGLEDYDAQATFVNALCDIARDTDMHVHLVAHSRKLQNEMSAPGKMDFKGTGTITDQVDNCITVWRNKPKEQSAEQGMHGMSNDPDLFLICDKQRHGDWEGKIGLWFDPQTMQFLSSAEARPQNLTLRLP